MPGKTKKGGGLESSPVYKKSPLYNYKSPGDYKVFNMGNKASPPFKMKGYSYSGTSPMKQDTGREKKIKQNIEFSAYAVEQGWAPKPPTAGDLSAKGRAELKAYEEFYGNPENVKKLNLAQKEYFKNK